MTGSIIGGKYEWRVLTTCALLCMVAAGCGSSEDEWTRNRPKRVPATGEVIYQGQPLAGALVTFINEEAERSAIGKTNEDGQFELTTYDAGDGAVPGPQVVSIRKVGIDFPGTELVGLTTEELQAALNAMTIEERYKIGGAVSRWQIPERYGAPETSELTADVVDGGENHFRFELDDQAKN